MWSAFRLGLTPSIGVQGMSMEDDDRLPPSPLSGDLGNQLRAAREAAGHSLATMAALTHFSKPYLGHVETGHRHPTPDVVDRYEQVLGVPIGIAHDPVRAAHEWLCGNQPPAGRPPKTGRRLGATQLRRLEARVIELRHRDDVVGSRELLPVVRAELDAVCRLADEALYTDRLGARLHTVIAELAQLVGWIASDAGHYRHAEQALPHGCRRSGHRRRPGLGWATAVQPRLPDHQHRQTRRRPTHRQDRRGRCRRRDPGRYGRCCWSAWPGPPPAATTPTPAAEPWTPSTTPTTSAAPESAEPEWVYWLNRAEIDVMAARCHIQLGQPAVAEPLLTRALADYNPDHVREVGLYQTWLAEGYARTGNHDAARHILDHIDTSAVEAGSVRLQRRIDAVTRLTTTRSH